MRKRGIAKKVASVLVAAAMVLGMCTISPADKTQKAEAATTKTTLSNPRQNQVEKNRYDFVYDCVWFGSYPQAEIITTEMSKNYVAVNSECIEDGDIIVSDSIYNSLSNAVNWDINGDTILNGIKYHRLKKEDVISYPKAFKNSAQYGSIL